MADLQSVLEDTAITLSLPKIEDNKAHEITLHLFVQDGCNLELINQKMNLAIGEITKPGTYEVRYIWNRASSSWMIKIRDYT